MSQTSAICPECRHVLAAEPGYVSWCEGCEWNLTPAKEPAPAHDMFEALYRRMSERGGKALYQSLAGTDLSRASARGKTWYLAMVFSALVLLVYPLPWIVGAWLLIAGWGNFMLIIDAVVLLGWGLFTWPGLPDPFPAGEVVARERLPQLYALVDQLCGLLQAPRIDGIVLTDQFNASVEQYGWKRRRVLFIGLPLWELLEPQERLVLLGHELGHLVSGDPLQGRLPEMAVRILFRTGDAIIPESMMPEMIVHGRVVVIEEWALVSAARLVMIPVNWLLVGVAHAFWGLGQALLGLMWAESQRAEYRSDLYGLQLGGLEASLSLLEKLSADDLVLDVLRQRITSRQKAPAGEVLGAIRQRWEILPASERERRLRLLRKENHRLDATHPATGARLAMLVAQKAHVRQLQVPGRDWKALDQELEPFREGIAARLLDQVRGSLYA